MVRVAVDAHDAGHFDIDAGLFLSLPHYGVRDTAASVLLAQGVPARVVMEILGHSQISVTLNTYGHVAPEVSREAADRVDQALWGDG